MCSPSSTLKPADKFKNNFLGLDFLDGIDEIVHSRWIFEREREVVRRDAYIGFARASVLCEPLVLFKLQRIEEGCATRGEIKITTPMSLQLDGKSHEEK